MKKTKTLTILMLIFKLASAQSSIGNSIIFLRQDKFAMPIVIFKKGQYIEPSRAWSMKEWQEGELSKSEINEQERLYKEFEKELSNYKTLYLLNDGIKYKSIRVSKVSTYNGASNSGPGLELISVPKYELLSNNPKLGTNPLLPLAKNDRPLIKKKRKIGEYFHEIDFNLISKVDIDGDGIPELIYDIITKYSAWIEIYSKKNGKWKKVYEGVADGE